MTNKEAIYILEHIPIYTQDMSKYELDQINEAMQKAMKALEKEEIT